MFCDIIYPRLSPKSPFFGFVFFAYATKFLIFKRMMHELADVGERMMTSDADMGGSA